MLKYCIYHASKWHFNIYENYISRSVELSMKKKIITLDQTKCLLRALEDDPGKYSKPFQSPSFNKTSFNSLNAE